MFQCKECWNFTISYQIIGIFIYTSFKSNKLTLYSYYTIGTHRSEFEISCNKNIIIKSFNIDKTMKSYRSNNDFYNFQSNWDNRGGEL